MTTYTTTQDYIDTNLAELGDITLTDEQAITIAQEMTEWRDGALVERTDRDFWNVVANVLGDN